MKQISKKRSFGGWQYVYEHDSEVLSCSMQFSVFLPGDIALDGTEKIPALWFLSGLTCSWENVTNKGFPQHACSKHNVAFICPDTSPRGEDVPDDVDRWDFGKGAGFYVDATQEPWSKNYKMYTYVTIELQNLIAEHFPIDVSKQGITGHSMGGHGALVLGLRNPDLYKSISAFSPICNPVNVPWGDLAFSRYLGDDKSTWSDYDATELVRSLTSSHANLLIDQGADDNFLKEQLSTSVFQEAASSENVTVRFQEGYDHSYFFISTFMEDHVDHFATAIDLK